MSVNDEIAAMEAAIDDLEKKIADGRLSNETSFRYFEKLIQGMSDSEIDANAEKLQAKIMEFSEIHRIDKQRIRELREHHPNDSRISKLAHRAADCYLKLCSISLPEDAESQKILNEQRKMLPKFFGL